MKIISTVHTLLKRGPLSISRFNEPCAHCPGRQSPMKWAIHCTDMQKANGKRCKTKRVWVYTPKHSWCIDWR